MAPTARNPANDRPKIKTAESLDFWRLQKLNNRRLKLLLALLTIVYFLCFYIIITAFLFGIVVEKSSDYSGQPHNISRFVLQQTANSKTQNPNNKQIQNSKLQKEDEDILKKLEQTKKAVSNYIDTYEFGQALHVLYEFIWHDVADKYIELSKKREDNNVKKVLSHVLLEILKMLHPFMPHLTEELYQHFPKKNKDFLIIEEW